MLRFILVSAFCMQLVWCDQPNGGGAFAYSDSTGHRYGGTYSLKDGQVVDVKGNIPPDFQVNYLYPDFDTFYPYYFRNLENILQETFDSNLKHQRIALNAARKAFDLTSNQAGYIQNLQYRFGSPGSYGFPPYHGYNPIMNGPPFGMNFGMPPANGAYAGAFATPGFSHQIAAINPSNPANPNVDQMERFSEDSRSPGYVSVSSSSYSSSSNVNGKTENHRGAETTVNNNGKVTKYKVQS
ncbi:hypothetical protein K1T71_002081 [Dendrolimus kikuchii]|uniref:Uncharacterized protein n=1 Tax=Dendrolimus kikuchii TaxID=765133 RepID=A0ACC1DGH1_9NEOP|nr:hypothetical protein K1T71_002081 [Dendrolimus kikuchii]